MLTNSASARLAYRTSTALAIIAVITSAASFFFWGLFHRDVPMTVGNLRGTALTMLVVAVPLLLWGVNAAKRGSVRAIFVWLAALAYIAYNAIMFIFAAHFSSLFIVYEAMLALVFWSFVTLLRAIDVDALRNAAAKVPVRAVSVYLIMSMIMFAGLWLVELIPASLSNTMPQVIVESGVTQNTVWAIDFAFTFPLMVLGALWLWQRRPWGYVIGGMMTLMLTIETAGIAVDQWFGHLHDPSASLGAIPIMIVFTGLGAVFSWVFLRGVGEPHGRTAEAASLLTS